MTGLQSTLVGRVVCFFRNHQAWPDYDAMVWNCDRCGASGPKLWMTAAWFVRDLRRRLWNDSRSDLNRPQATLGSPLRTRS